jgi:hypothetical protein
VIESEYLLNGEWVAFETGMILFVSPYQNAPDCAELIQHSTREQVKIVNSIRLALAALRTGEFTAVVADENLLECSPGSGDSLLQRMGSGIPVFVDMACLRVERVAKLVGVAFKRREVVWKFAREQAICELKNELKSDLTGLLLSSEMAVKVTSLPPAAAEKVLAVLEIAKRIRERLNA